MSGLVTWSRDEDKAFENAIAMYYKDESNKEQFEFEKIASMVPTKTLEQVKQHYEILVEDLNAIEGGLVPLPNYTEKDPPHHVSKEASTSYNYGIGLYGEAKAGSKSEQERRKGIPWSEEEHRMFLLGLDKFGKGDWRSISRNFVISRTPTQVASHAQKYFNRLNSTKRDRRRSSIHDITSINNAGEVCLAQGPVTVQQTNTTNAVGTAIGSSMKYPMINMRGIGVYGAPIGHPVAPGGHMVSAVGTPVMMPNGHHPVHPPYVPLAYPVVPPAMHK